ncbi:hypothetical protein IWX90DRAFT_299873 [Phyllosticta citrichinensis]|uniref:Uncharacterized protein n=1 Tax=Phyllosticta citrichinensis TaxID=1130410 RepID=A0ABR1XKY1_9PEZI
MVFFLFPFSPSRLVSFAIIIIIIFFFFFFVIFFRFFFSRSHCPASSSPLNCCSAACASPGNKMQARTDRHPDPALWIDGWGDAERDGTRRDADDGRTDGQTDRRRGACTTRARGRGTTFDPLHPSLSVSNLPIASLLVCRLRRFNCLFVCLVWRSRDDSVCLTHFLHYLPLNNTTTTTTTTYAVASFHFSHSPLHPSLTLFHAAIAFLLDFARSLDFLFHL